MSQETIERWMPSTVTELRDALDEMLEAAAMLTEDGLRPDAETVYLDVRDLALVKQTLSDGSVAFNVVVRENK